MKKFGKTLLAAVACLAVVGYFGLQAYLYFSDPLTTTACYTYQLEETLSVTGYVVRSEVVLTGQTSGLLRLSRTEGERVSAGGEVAVVYADQASVDRQGEIDNLETQIEQLEYAQQSALSGEVSLKLDNQILSAMTSLRQHLTADQLDEAEDHITTLRGLILKRDYTYTDSEDLDAQLESLKSQLQTLKNQAASGARTITAPQSGIYSAVVDGYESVLTPESLEDITPSQLLSVQEGAADDSGLGKLIVADTWYYAATINESDAAGLKEGQTLTLRFPKEDADGYSMKIQSISEPESGRVAVVFSCSGYVQDVTLLRQQSAELVTDSVTGLRVPKEAVRVNEEGQTGVYCILGRKAQFKPVKVLYTSDEFVLVSSTAEKESARIRPGDEVIVSANDLYNGKIVT